MSPIDFREKFIELYGRVEGSDAYMDSIGYYPHPWDFMEDVPGGPISNNFSLNGALQSLKELIILKC